MRRAVITALVVVAAAMLLAPLASHANPRVSVVHQGFGYKGTDSVRVNEDVIFQLYLNNDENFNFMVQHGFRIYSPDGAVWSGPVRWDTLAGVIPRSNFDLTLGTRVRRGVGEDTACLIAAFVETPGIPPNFSGPVWSIHIGSFTEADIGKRICIDSAWYPPAGKWFWCGINGANGTYPDWGGPYCFTITRCCNGMSGDAGASGSPDYVPSIGDLQYFIDNLFGGQPMSTCPGEVDFDHSGSVDINDLQMMVEFLFSGAQLPNCP